METETSPNDIRGRIEQIIAGLNKDLFEKDKAIRMALLSALAGESLFLLGPPGVAKSMIARRLKYAFSEAKSFEYLMGKFSTPDEVFGPVSIRKLKDEDKYERLTDKYLPGANIVFLDEIWKASPPIQNALLTVLNEKIYRNGEQEFHVDIRGLISASNELPLKNEGLEALWDRFLIRLVVKNIESEALFNKMLMLPSAYKKEEYVAETHRFDREEYDRCEAGIDDVGLPSHILGLLNHLRRSVRERNATAEPEDQMYISDRRWRKMSRLLRTSAFLNGRTEVDLMDCFLMADCMWDQLHQLEEAQALVLGSIASYGYRKLVNIQPITAEMDALREEIERETRIVSFETVPVRKVYKDETGNGFHRVEAFFGDSPAFIRVGDANRLEEEGSIYVPIFEQTGSSFRPFQTYQVSLESEFVLKDKGRSLTIESGDEQREVVTPRLPSPETVKIWDSQIQLLMEMVEKGLKVIEDRRSADEQHLTTNLFVSREKAAHVMDSLETAKNELLNIKLDIEKTRHQYESIEAGG
ncbi:MAG: AAA family ATPase [Bacteroidota bacterium]